MPTQITTITNIASLDLIPKPREYDSGGLITAQTVKNLDNDNIDVFVKIAANTIDYKLIFFYPDTTNGSWYVHPDNETTATTVVFATNKGRKYSRFLIASSLLGCHFALWQTAGSQGDITEAYLIPCRRGGGLR